MGKNTLTIREAAIMLGVSTDTLRRWDKSGKLPSIQVVPRGHRRYKKEDIERFVKNIANIAWEWEIDTAIHELDPRYFCPDSAVFQARLEHFRSDLSRLPAIASIHSLIVAVAGEIGNNSFDHNLGNWPDVRGIFFGYDLRRKQVVLADRGIGIFTSLKRVRPELPSHTEALKIAFTERLSGRSPESRGNGLKLVRKIVTENPFILDFRSGDARLILRQGDDTLDIWNCDWIFKGCYASLTF